MKHGQLDRFKPSRTVFLLLDVCNADDTVEIESAMVFKTRKLAMKAASKEVEQHGGEMFVFKLTPLLEMKKC